MRLSYLDERDEMFIDDLGIILVIKRMSKKPPSESTGGLTREGSVPPAAPKIVSKYGGYNPPSEAEVRAKQAMAVIMEFGREVKRLGDLLISKDTRLEQCLDKFTGDVDLLMNNYAENSEVTLTDLKDVLKSFDDAQEGFKKIMETQGEGFDRLSRGVSDTKIAITNFSQSASMYLEAVGRFNTSVSQSLAELKQLISSSETPLGRSTLGEKVPRPAAVLHASNERTIITKLESMNQEISALPQNLAKTTQEIEALKGAVKKVLPTSEAIKANNEVLVARILEELQKAPLSTLKISDSNHLKEELTEAQEKITSLQEELEEQKKIALEARKKSNIKIDRRAEEELRQELDALREEMSQLKEKNSHSLDEEKEKAALLQEEIAKLQATNKRLTDQTKQAASSAEDRLKVIREHEATTKKLETAVEQLEEKKDRIKELEKAVTEKALSASLVDQKSKDIERLTRELRDRENQLQSSNRMAKEKDKEISSLKTQLEQTCTARDEKIEQLKTQLEQIRTTRDDKIRELTEKIQELSDSQAIREKVVDEVSKEEKELSDDEEVKEIEEKPFKVAVINEETTKEVPATVESPSAEKEVAEVLGDEKALLVADEKKEESRAVDEESVNDDPIKATDEESMDERKNGDSFDIRKPSSFGKKLRKRDKMRETKEDAETDTAPKIMRKGQFRTKK